MLQNARVTAFTVSELLRENQQGGLKLPPTQIRVKEVLKNRPYVIVSSYRKVVFENTSAGHESEELFPEYFYLEK